MAVEEEPERAIKPDSFQAMTPEERRAVEKAASYAAHAVRGTLGIHYFFYPEDRPQEPPRPPGHENEGRER